MQIHLMRAIRVMRLMAVEAESGFRTWTSIWSLCLRLGCLWQLVAVFVGVGNVLLKWWLWRAHWRLLRIVTLGRIHLGWMSFDVLVVI